MTWQQAFPRGGDHRERKADAAMSFMTWLQKSLSDDFAIFYIGQPYSKWEEIHKGMTVRRQEAEKSLEAGFYRKPEHVLIPYNLAMLSPLSLPTAVGISYHCSL